jgi:hypothetical protein
MCRETPTEMNDTIFSPADYLLTMTGGMLEPYFPPGTYLLTISRERAYGMTIAQRMKRFNVAQTASLLTMSRVTAYAKRSRHNY